MAHESGAAPAPDVSGRPRLLDRVHEAARRRYFSRRTEEAYVHWIKRFIYFHGKRHPASLGESEVTAFLNHLAAERSVAASTQNQALSGLLFLYREVLGRKLAWLDGLQRASRPPRLPTVLTRAEVERLLAGLSGARSRHRPDTGRDWPLLILARDRERLAERRGANMRDDGTTRPAHPFNLFESWPSCRTGADSSKECQRCRNSSPRLRMMTVWVGQVCREIPTPAVGNDAGTTPA